MGPRWRSLVVLGAVIQLVEGSQAPQEWRSSALEKRWTWSWQGSGRETFVPGLRFSGAVQGDCRSFESHGQTGWSGVTCGGRRRFPCSDGAESPKWRQKGRAEIHQVGQGQEPSRAALGGISSHSQAGLPAGTREARQSHRPLQQGAVAREQQRDARLVLRQVAFHEEVDDAMVEEDTGDVWSQMVADWDQERADQDDGILQRALLERVGRSRTPVPSGRAPARSPVPGGPRSATAEEAPSYRPMYNEGSPTLLHARADPYPATSPRMAADIKPDHRTAPPDAAEIPVLGTSPVHPHQKEGEPGRKSVKEMTRTLPERVSPHSDFAERIAGRRNALLPFGVPPGLHGQASPVPPAVTEVLDADSVPEAVPGGNTVSNLPSTE